VCIWLGCARAGNTSTRATRQQGNKADPKAFSVVVKMKVLDFHLNDQNDSLPILTSRCIHPRHSPSCLHPASAECRDSELELTIIKTRLGDPDSYEYLALSYTWGDPEPKYPVRVNGRRFMVSRNLHEALLQFRPRPVIKNRSVVELKVARSQEAEVLPASARLGCQMPRGGSAMYRTDRSSIIYLVYRPRQHARKRITSFSYARYL
jgi:hypothetical protein